MKRVSRREIMGATLALLAGAVLMPATVRGQLFVAFSGGAEGMGTIGEYTTSGTPVNANLVTGLSFPVGLAVSGSDLFVTTYNNVTGKGGIGEYTTSGAIVNASLVSGLPYFPQGVAVSGTNLFVVGGGSYSNPQTGTIGEYTTSGAIVNASLVTTGLATPIAVAVSGSSLFIANYYGGSVGEFTVGATPGTISSSNPALIPGLGSPTALALSGSELFVMNFGSEIAEYTLAGATVNANLLSTFGSTDYGFVVVGDDIFVTSNSNESITEYTTSGATVNTHLVTGVEYPAGIVYVPEPGSLCLLALGSVGLLARRRRR